MRLSSAFGILGLACEGIQLGSGKYLVPGGRWRDTEGNVITAHAGGITREEKTGRFFWFGEKKVEGHVEGAGVNVYSSDDLVTWEYNGLALAPIEGHPYLSPDHIIQRPKVVYSIESGLYNMWWHADNASFGLLLQGVATSPNITGPYTFIDAFSPLGNWSQDYGMFTDRKNGETYSLYSNGDSVLGRDDIIARMNNERNNLTEVVYTFTNFDLEAPTIVQTEKSYYALMSHKTGYRLNDVVAFRAENLSGPWSQPFPVAPLGTRTYSSQSGFTLTVVGDKQTTHLYIGDQWDANSLWESRYIWLPMDIDDEKGELKLVWNDVYELDIHTGEWRVPEGTVYYGKNAKVNGNAFKQEANFASLNTIVTGIYGNESTVTFEGVEGTGKPQWVSFYYQNIDDMGFGDQPGGSPDRIGGKFALRRISSVVVNGKIENLDTLYQWDTNKGVIHSAPLLLTLDEGSNNTITIGGLNNGIDFKGADIDRIVVYPPEQ
ncbi:hypothetical protein E1B28_007653 [Marasmius oreades]|uniref:Uncharacterized protein n=1 Tax=Marasmius oreades TaxID=181124 RepID=A0A9P7S225_9AGAR|nr:uncharacterized protein E1B28_007653 [Marasmius oreades]KAG7094031.1 hypothetical protein E1B28_007653 [Marasmius oreades]